MGFVNEYARYLRKTAHNAKPPLPKVRNEIESLSLTEREFFEERAAIMEFDGGLSREEAEWEAVMIIKAYKKTEYNKVISNPQQRKKS